MNISRPPVENEGGGDGVAPCCKLWPPKWGRVCPSPSFEVECGGASLGRPPCPRLGVGSLKKGHPTRSPPQGPPRHFGACDSFSYRKLNGNLSKVQTESTNIQRKYIHNLAAPYRRPNEASNEHLSQVYRIQPSYNQYPTCNVGATSETPSGRAGGIPMGSNLCSSARIDPHHHHHPPRISCCPPTGTPI